MRNFYSLNYKSLNLLKMITLAETLANNFECDLKRLLLTKKMSKPQLGVLLRRPMGHLFKSRI